MRGSATVVFTAAVIARVTWCAELKTDAVRAWDTCTATALAQMQARLTGSKLLVWLDAEHGNLHRLRAGGIVIEPTVSTGRVAVPDALIHDWTGAIFLPGASAHRVLDLLDQYDRYPEFYGPTVVRCRLTGSEGNRRRFSMRWARKTAFVSHAIDADYESEYFQVSPGRWWSYSRTTRVQEVEHYGRPGERLRPAGTGAGYIWRLFSLTDVTDFESGCIVEVRAMVLSRDVPSSLAWFVNPIVTRIARSALTTTLKQTRGGCPASGNTGRPFHAVLGSVCFSGSRCPSAIGDWNPADTPSSCFFGNLDVQNTFTLWHDIPASPPAGSSAAGKHSFALRNDGEEGHGIQVGHLEWNLASTERVGTSRMK